MTDDRTARAKAFIKTPVTHDADACFDANDEVICFAETDNSVCPSDRRVTRAINCLEEIAQALNARPEHSHLEAENKRLREGLEVAKETIETMPCFCKIGRICSSCQSIAKIKAILNGKQDLGKCRPE